MINRQTLLTSQAPSNVLKHSLTTFKSLFVMRRNVEKVKRVTIKVIGNNEPVFFLHRHFFKLIKILEISEKGETRCMQISGTKVTKINAGYYAPPNHKRPTDVSADLKTFL